METCSYAFSKRFVKILREASKHNHDELSRVQSSGSRRRRLPGRTCASIQPTSHLYLMSFPAAADVERVSYDVELCREGVPIWAY